MGIARKGSEFRPARPAALALKDRGSESRGREGVAETMDTQHLGKSRLGKECQIVAPIRLLGGT
ncbi:MAG: hypothetical protein ACK58T_43450 [Phycisphaerae bacterium]